MGDNFTNNFTYHPHMSLNLYTNFYCNDTLKQIYQITETIEIVKNIINFNSNKKVYFLCNVSSQILQHNTLYKYTV